MLALAAPLAVALKAAYDASLLAGVDPTSAAATRQGHHVAVVVGGCVVAAALLRLALTPLDRRLVAIDVPALSARLKAAVAAGIAVVLIAGAFAAGLPARISHDVDTFVHSTSTAQATDLRSRLTDPSNRARIDHWNVALDAFGREPLRGSGLGNYENEWARHREEAFAVVNAHSLYLETLSDLGLVGGLLLIVALGSIVVAFARRARGEERALYGALLACAIAWALCAGVDWHWQMPATTVWLFALGGVALSARGPLAPRAATGREPWRVAAAAAWLALLVTPLLLTISQSRLQTAMNRFDDGDCRAATRMALASMSVLDVRPQAYEIVGYCDLEAGYPRLAVRAMERAVALDPAQLGAQLRPGAGARGGRERPAARAGPGAAGEPARGADAHRAARAA